jgi:hypothetical protein
MKRFLSAITVTLVCLLHGHSFAQVDPQKVLPGRWEGWFELVQPGGNPARNLIISSVEPIEDGRWKAKGRMGEPGAPKLLGVEIDITREGEDIYLSWIYGTIHTPVRVKLVGTDRLEGTHRPYKFSVAGGGQRILAVSFQRAPTKDKAPTQ